MWCPQVVHSLQLSLCMSSSSYGKGWICQQLLPPQVKSLTPVVSCSRHQWPQRWRRFHWGVLKDSLLRQEALSILPVLSLPEYSARQESCIRLQTASSPIVAGAAA